MDFGPTGTLTVPGTKFSENLGSAWYPVPYRGRVPCTRPWSGTY